MNLAIDAKGLHKKFGSYTAVEGVTFQLPEGKKMAFVGPNGAGKTTTIRLLCGVLVPTEGTAFVLGHDVMTQAEEIKQKIGYMSQKFSLYDDLTVEENMNFYAGVYNLSGQRKLQQKQKIIELVGLKERLGQLVQSLSGGWKQRVSLACALLHDPKLIVLDEPTAGVDPVSRRIFWNIINLLAGQGMTILVSTHYMDEADSCDYIGFVFNGKLIAFGTPQEMKEREHKKSLDDLFIYYVEQEASDDPRNKHIKKEV
ncbi:ABC transporter related [Desulfofarcimen acetoxidans DSM 771]|uniref:ABC transporter related n=1 Tax=Desulfofarcimen acetoxidans (strain ATCC 49208 / DSM 771 / KCTC 5769 / VKM B-1644 / 5575) TaxID=485916 RepID=C8W1V3_DESAS|nr:ABC transporter ATP-binding protein [Desulfofarcimen acetoxidans]ACV63574.1 ABC transporter related [Desulfofarcimen acetoxidans DSM 771]